MKRIIIALFVAALTIPLIGQEARIMIVEKSDSQRLAKAYREYQDALKHWNEVKSSTAQQYTKADGKTIEGWEKVQFSADFRALVPEASQYAGSGRTWSNGCITLTNAVGTSSGATLAYDSTNNLAVPSDVSVNPDLVVKDKR